MTASTEEILISGQIGKFHLARGFSEIAFKRAGKLGDGFIYAGDHDRCLEEKAD